MSSPRSSTTRKRPATESALPAPFEGLDEPLAGQLPTFELFFKTFGFRRVLGRIWGLLVLSGQPLSSKEISEALHLSQGATSTALSELTEWGAVQSEFDHERRCHLHSAVSNTLSIVATVLRRREQVVFGQFKQAAERTLQYVSDRYGEKDPRVFTLRSIISTCEIAEGVMGLVFGSVASALDDPESLLSKAVQAAFRIGVAAPSRTVIGRTVIGRTSRGRAALESGPDLVDEADEPVGHGEDSEA
jgi:hypothetical protein